MSDQITIGVNDKQTAEALQQELASLGIQTQRHSQKQVISFGARIKAGGVFEAEFTPKEIIELLEGIGPAVVNALFNTLEKFRDRIQLFINGEPKDISQERTQRIFEAFLKK